VHLIDRSIPCHLRELANPNLHDIPRNLPFRVELWDRHEQHIRWTIAASSSVAIGHAALDTAIASYPDQRSPSPFASTARRSAPRYPNGGHDAL